MKALQALPTAKRVVHGPLHDIHDPTHPNVVESMFSNNSSYSLYQFWALWTGPKLSNSGIFKHLSHDSIPFHTTYLNTLPPKNLVLQ